VGASTLYPDVQTPPIGRRIELEHEITPPRAPRGRLLMLAEAPLPTRNGTVRCLVFALAHDPARQHVALIAGDVRGDGVLVRVHSECLTSEAFGSLKCDCREQLDGALARIAEVGRGAVIYLRQEGRGIGLANKVKAYALQACGLDTVDANRALGLPDDARSYDAAALVLAELGIESVRLLSNNPDKVQALGALGVDIVERVPLVIAPRAESAAYLEAKRTRMHHALPALDGASSGTSR
jgi:GTP cyclohydrolase II